MNNDASDLLRAFAKKARARVVNPTDRLILVMKILQDSIRQRPELYRELREVVRRGEVRNLLLGSRKAAS
jgi:hypothetical protein